MSSNLRHTAATFAIATLLVFIAVVVVEQSNWQRLEADQSADQQSLLELASHNLSPFVLSGDRLAAQAELNFLVDTTRLEYAVLNSPTGQTIAEAGTVGTTTLVKALLVNGERAAELRVRIAAQADADNAWLRPLALSLCAGVLLAIGQALFLARSEKRYLQLGQRLSGALQQPLRADSAEAALDHQIGYLEEQLAALDETGHPPAAENSRSHLFLLLSMARLRDWARVHNPESLAKTLSRFEERLLGMLALYGGKPVAIDEHRILLDFGATTPRRVRQATVFAMGVSGVLARCAGEEGAEPLPVSGSLFQLPDYDRLLSFTQCNRTALEARLDETEDLAPGHLLVEMNLLDPSIDDLLVRVRPLQHGLCVECIDPSVLQLWEQQFQRLSRQH